MIDLHTHTIFSDGDLLPAELGRRFEAVGYAVVALTDHADPSNIDWLVPRLVAAAAELNPHVKIRLVPGVELTHLPPVLIPELAARAKALGARVVVVHGETLVEPVPPGTNRAAVLCPDVDILAHPGLISPDEVRLAAERGLLLEVTSRSGHSLSNGHVVRLAREAGASLVIDSDTHAPEDIVSPAFADTVGLAAGLSPAEVQQARDNARRLLESRQALD